jgi:hypothetical protein
MSTGLRELTDADLDEALERVLVPRLSTLLAARTPGHCMRVTDLSTTLATRLCRRLRTAAGDGAQVHVLGQPPNAPADVAVTSTKLVELRNPDAEGHQRPPLLVFIPPGTYASAEDSFDVATFEQATLGDVYQDLVARLHASVPNGLRTAVAELFGVLDDQVDESGQPPAGPLERARYLLTLAHNDHDPQAAGAALFELGLIPDFELFSDLSQVRTRATRNARVMRVLNHPDRSVRQRVIDLHLTDPTFRAKLAGFTVTAGLDSSREWTRRIVIDPTNWGLSFHRWPLPEDRNTPAVRITVGDLDLPHAGAQPQHAEHPVLRNITGQPYLLASNAGHNQLPVGFEVTPDPRQVAGLVAFSVQLISEDSGPTGVHATVRVSTAAKRAYKATVKRLRAAHLDDGWHYIRVLPLDSGNVPLPVETSDLAARRGDRHADQGSQHAFNESDRFYVVADNDIDEPPPRPRTGKNVGVTQELRRLEFEALAERREWQSITCQRASWKAGTHSVIEANFGAHGAVEVPLAPALAELERQILAEPDRITPRRVISSSGQPARVAAAEQASSPRGPSEPLAAFLRARADVLRAIHGDAGMVLAGRDLLAIRAEALAYAEAYAELLSRQMQRAERTTDTDLIRQLATLLQIDTVAVEHRDLRGNINRLTLVSPTHPLRLLWLVTWAQLGHRWLTDASDTNRDTITAASHTLLALRPAGFPLAVVGDDARLSVAAADLTPYWGACLPTETDDPHALLADVAASLGIPDHGAVDITIAPGQIADRLERYVRMHPYVRTLVVCAVNPGRGEHLADTLIELERRKNLRHLSYDVRLFTPDPKQLDTGDALAQLLRGEWSAAAEAEAFSTPTVAGLTPKLAVAVLPLDEFRSATSRHAAHITMLFDAFSGEILGLGPSHTEAPAPVHGLVQQMTVDYVDTDDGTVAWHKQPRHGQGRGLPGAEECSDLLATLPAVISAAAAAVTSGETGTGLVPRTTLSLTAEDNTLLHQAHRCSDWVITVDRTLGVEYFDSPGSPRRPDYVIDFATAGTDGLGHHLVVSSRSVDELRSLLTPVIDQHGFQIDRSHAATFFDQLRLLSGRLAFKIASTSPNQRTEVLGLALARLYLDYQGVLSDQILVPLDSHLELYREARRRADEVTESVGLQRTDLALFSLDARRRTITCRLVEVKCHASLNTITDIQKLHDRITEQLNRSATVLAENFDPAHAQPDRPDRAVRNAELATLLRFYLGRAVRHGIMNADAAGEAQWLLDHLDWGFRLEFTRTGLIFDLRGTGSERESEGDIEFHRIGRDLMEELLSVIPTDPMLAPGQRLETITSATLASCDITVPRLAGAAFRAPARSHDLPEDATSHHEPDLTVPGDSSRPVVDEHSRDDESVAEPAPPAIADPAAASPPPAAPQARKPTSPSASGTLTPAPDIYLGSTQSSPQYGIIGEYSGRRVALDLNETHTISLFGVQGGGKSYTLGSIIEAASLAGTSVNRLPRPLATIVFHYSPTLDYAPEFTSMIRPNTDAEQVRALRERYGAEPAALDQVVMLVPEDQLRQRRDEYPGIEVLPLKFGSGELRASHWRFLMGAVGNQSTYIRQLGRIMKANRNSLSLDVIRDGVDQSQLSDSIKQLAHQRLDLAADYIDDTVRIKELIRPGRMIIVDLRDELIEKDEALGLFVVLMELFAEATSDGERFNKLVVFDEAHKYIESPDLVAGLVESVREMRHKGMSILVASQDPPSVPIPLIELSNHIILHKFNSPAWLKHLQKANAALADLTSTKMTALTPGEAYVWSSKATDLAFTRGAVKVRFRPRVTRHGGGTKTAVDAPD